MMLENCDGGWSQDDLPRNHALTLELKLIHEPTRRRVILQLFGTTLPFASNLLERTPSATSVLAIVILALRVSRESTVITTLTAEPNPKSFRLVLRSTALLIS